MVNLSNQSTHYWLLNKWNPPGGCIFEQTSYTSAPTFSSLIFHSASITFWHKTFATPKMREKKRKKHCYYYDCRSSVVMENEVRKTNKLRIHWKKKKKRTGFHPEANHNKWWKMGILNLNLPNNTYDKCFVGKHCSCSVLLWNNATLTFSIYGNLKIMNWTDYN